MMGLLPLAGSARDWGDGPHGYVDSLDGELRTGQAALCRGYVSEMATGFPVTE